MSAAAQPVDTAEPVVGESPFSGDPVLSSYLDILSHIERLHRLLLDVIKDEFERLGQIDVTPVQALLLFNIGDAEVTAGELKTRGYYQGSNVSYNLKKLVEGGYISHERCSVDRRAVRIALTEKGRELRGHVCALWDGHVSAFRSDAMIDLQGLDAMGAGMRTLERFWAERIRYIY